MNSKVTVYYSWSNKNDKNKKWSRVQNWGCELVALKDITFSQIKIF